MMTAREMEQIEAAIRELEASGFDVKSLWREYSERVSAEQKAWSQPAPKATLDLGIDEVLSGATNPVLILAQRDLALGQEIARLSLEHDRLEQKLLRISLSRTERKATEQSLRRLRVELTMRHAARSEALALRKKFVASARRKKKRPIQTSEPTRT